MDSRARFVEVCAKISSDKDYQMFINIDDINKYYLNDDCELILGNLGYPLPLSKPVNKRLYDYLVKTTIILGE